MGTKELEQNDICNSYYSDEGFQPTLVRETRLLFLSPGIIEYSQAAFCITYVVVSNINKCLPKVPKQ